MEGADRNTSKAVVPYVSPPHLSFNIIPPPPQRFLSLLLSFKTCRLMTFNSLPLHTFDSQQKQKQEEINEDPVYETTASLKNENAVIYGAASPKQDSNVFPEDEKEDVLQEMQLPFDCFAQAESVSSEAAICSFENSLFCASQMYNNALQEEDHDDSKEAEAVPAKKRRDFQSLVENVSSLTQAYVVGLEDAAYMDGDSEEEVQPPLLPVIVKKKSPISSARPQIVVWPWQSQRSPGKEHTEKLIQAEVEGKVPEGPQKRFSLNLKPVPPEVAVYRDFKPPSRIKPVEKPDSIKPKPKPILPDSDGEVEVEQSGAHSLSSNYCPIANLPKLPQVVPGRQRRIGLPRRTNNKP